MPNHVKNILTVENVTEKRFKQICDFVASEKKAFDFNKIVPMPEDLNIPEGGSNVFFKAFYEKYCRTVSLDSNHNADCTEVLKQISGDELSECRRRIEDPIWGEYTGLTDPEIIRTAFRFGGLYQSNRDFYGGCETWYSWRIQNWGTKWNAYNICAPEEEMFGWEFSTAWSAPEPVLTVLSAIFRDARFVLRYADEDLGHNCGILEFENGEEREFSALTDESAYQFACELWGYDPAEWGEDEEDMD